MLTLLCAVAFLYPYVLYPLVLRRLPRLDQDTTGAHEKSAVPSAALLMCAYNEEASLPGKIENLRRMKKECPELQIFAYSDCSSDNTNALLEGASDILTPVLGTERAGKVRGMYHLIGLTDADVAVFTDANVMVDEGSITNLLERFRDPNIGAVAATLIYEDKDDGEQSATSDVGGAYWKLEEHIKELESSSGSMMGADGAFFARRRAGYPQIPADLVDDMAVSIGVLFDGQRCVSAHDVIGREHSVTHRGEEFKRKRRIACGSYSTYRYLKPSLKKLSRLDRFKFLSHKLMRWWGGAFLTLGIIAFLGAAASAGFGLAGVGIVAAGGGLVIGLGHLNVAPFGAVYEVLLAVLATGLGVIESLKGASYATWEPAKTR
ncbi:MAG: glycosyltransferase [Gammaproteobacteria bacterium]